MLRAFLNSNVGKLHIKFTSIQVISALFISNIFLQAKRITRVATRRHCND